MISRRSAPPTERLRRAFRTKSGAVVGAEGVRATLGSGVNLDFWLRTEQPAGANTNPAATFPDLSVGTLVGVVPD